MRTVAYLIAGFVISSTGLQLFGQEGDPKDSLQKALNGQFALTQITNDRSDIVSAGAVLVLQKGGLMMYSTASPMPPLNTYKNGKISQGGSGFGRDLLITMAAPGGSTASDYPHRQFAAGEKLWVTGLGVQKGGIVFNLYSDPYDGIRYYGQLKLPFEKGSVPTPDQAMARIAEVLTVQQAAPPEPEPPQGGPQTPLSGVYLWPQSRLQLQLQLNTDGSFSLLKHGQVSPGRFTVNGDTLVLTYTATGGSDIFKIQGDKMYADTGLAWVRQGGAPAPPVPSTPPLKLPSTYVNAQTPSDQLQLNADNSFALQEAGQTYHGTFAVSGSTLELNISENSTKTSVTIQGNNLTDSSGQTWVLQEQSAGTALGGAMLQNEDVIKMAKAGFDDAIIIAKISSSKCQFDTSTDALILLKKSGVSAAVLKAMLGAGK
jgi:hypothetical protein